MITALTISQIIQIIAIVYGIIGICVVFHEHNKYYKKEYDELKKRGETEDSAYIIYMMMVWILWPVNLAVRYWQQKKKQKA